MADQFRTSISLVYWTADATAAQEQADEIGAVLPDDDARAAMLTTIEFIEAGKPEQPEPESEGE